MQDEIELEVFRAGSKASRGITAANLADVAAFDCDANPVSAVIGHPKSDSPAEANILGFRVDGNSLFARVANWSDKLVDGIRGKRLVNRSMAFFSPDHEANPTPGKWAPRHLGFLGGSAPGIPGMPKLADAFSFNADDDLVIEGDPATAVIFEAPAETPVVRVKEEPRGMPKETDAEFEARDAKLKADEQKLADDRAAFEARAETSRKAANKSRVAALVTAGRVLPADSAALELVFNALNEDELEFSADDKGLAADKLAAILGKGPKLVDTNGKPLSPAKSPTFEAGDKSTDHHRITAAARELMEGDKSLSFEAAVERVSSEMEG